MIDVIGSEIEDQIVHEIKTAKFFTILADEVTDWSNLEQVYQMFWQWQTH